MDREMLRGGWDGMQESEGGGGTQQLFFFFCHYPVRVSAGPV